MGVKQFGFNRVIQQLMKNPDFATRITNAAIEQKKNDPETYTTALKHLKVSPEVQQTAISQLQNNKNIQQAAMTQMELDFIQLCQQRMNTPIPGIKNDNTDIVNFLITIIQNATDFIMHDSGWATVYFSKTITRVVLDSDVEHIVKHNYMDIYLRTYNPGIVIHTCMFGHEEKVHDIKIDFTAQERTTLHNAFLKRSDELKQQQTLQKITEQRKKLVAALQEVNKLMNM